MVNFDIFSQPQGPNIDVSLFPRVSQAGTETGLRLGTGFSNAVEGAFSGIERGQQIRDREQQAELRQNQIDQLPITNQIQELQLEQQRLQNIKLQQDIAELPLDEKIKRQQLRNSELLQEKTELAIEQEKLTNNSQINARLKSDRTELLALTGNPTTENRKKLAEAIESGRFNDLFGTFQENAVKRYYDTAFPYFSPQFQEIYRDNRNKSEKLTADQEELKQALKERGGIRADLAADSTAAGLKSRLKLTEYDFLQKGEIRNEGEPDPLDPTKTIPGGKKIKSFYLDGKLVERDVDGTFAGRFDKAKSNFLQTNRLLSGQGGVTDALTEAQKVQEQEAKTKQQPAAPSTPIAATADNPEQAARLAAKNKIRAKLGKEPITFSQKVEAETFEEPVQVSELERFTPALRGKPELVKAIALTPSVTSVESSGNKKAVSPKGARGLMQVMPGTFDYVTKKYKLKDRNIDNPVDNVEVGQIYLAEQIKTFGANPGQGLELALAAYNTGPGRVADALQAAEEKSWRGVKAELKKMLNPSAYAEVSSYPDKVFSSVVKLNSDKLTGTALDEETNETGESFTTDTETITEDEFRLLTPEEKLLFRRDKKNFAHFKRIRARRKKES